MPNPIIRSTPPEKVGINKHHNLATVIVKLLDI